MSSPDDEVHGVDPDEEADFDVLFLCLRRGLLRGVRGDRAGATGMGEAGSHQRPPQLQGPAPEREPLEKAGKKVAERPCSLSPP